MIICSYPRSGSTWLRFILCNLFYPGIEHDFDSVNRHIPDILDREGMRRAIDRPSYYKSHGFHHSQKILFLHRHVGDVLISEWWYKRKFHDDARSLEEYLQADDYGRGWREHIRFYFPCNATLGYDQLSLPAMILRAIPQNWCAAAQIQRAIDKSNFLALRRAEEKGFGAYPEGNKEIKFIREGKSGQWLELSPELQGRIIDKNLPELKMLHYL